MKKNNERFGKVSLAQQGELEAITDQARLDQIFSRSLKAENWNDLLTTPN